jgi:hypothetical protein
MAAAQAAAVLRNGRRALRRALTGRVRGRLRRALDELASDQRETESTPMAVSPAAARAIVERVCARPDVLDACARRDLGAVVSALTDKRTGGLTQGKITELTGIPQGRLSEWKTGIREAKGMSSFLKFADGLALPPAARRALRIDSTGPVFGARPQDDGRPRRVVPGLARRGHAERLRALAYRSERSHRTAARHGRSSPVE